MLFNNQSYYNYLTKIVSDDKIFFEGKVLNFNKSKRFILSQIYNDTYPCNGEQLLRISLYNLLKYNEIVLLRELFELLKNDESFLSEYNYIKYFLDGEKEKGEHIAEEITVDTQNLCHHYSKAFLTFQLYGELLF